MDPEIRIKEVDASSQVELIFTQEIEFPDGFAETLNN